MKYLGQQIAEFLVVVAQLVDLSSYVSAGDASTPSCALAAWLRHRLRLPHQL